MTNVRRLLAVLLLSFSFIAPALAETAQVKTPEWVRSGVIYEIYPRQFSPTGDFKGVEAGLDHMQQTGISILWLMPINPIGEAKKKGTIGSPYAVKDYLGINPAYGTAADLKSLVRAAHQRGMKVIVDVVLNHTAWDNPLITQHKDWYKQDASGNVIPPNPDWVDVAGLNYKNPQLRAYMIDALKYWVREFDLDGFRADVAGEVPTDFWETARAELMKVKPDIFMLAEASKPELMVKAFDADYAWPFYHALASVIMDGNPSSEVQRVWTEERAKFPTGALTMRFADDHDEMRGITRFGQRAMLAAMAIVFTSDGVPLVYNGNENGDSTQSGDPALFEKLPIFWPIAKRFPEYPKFYSQMAALRKAHPALQQGETMWLKNSDPSRVLTYLRKSGDETVLVAVNLSSQPFSGSVDAGAARFEDITPSFREDSKPATFVVPDLKLGAWEFRVLRAAP